MTETPKKRIVPRHLQAKIDAALEIESASLQLERDLKYPINVQNNVMLTSYMPDIVATLVYHLIRRGWRQDESKAVIKPRPVVGGAFEDLVAYVPMDEPDEPIYVGQPTEPDQQLWSVKPVLNEISEERPSD